MSISTTSITTSPANVYVSTGSTAITSLSFTNYDATDVLLDVWVVPSGNSVSNTNITLSQLSITAGDTYQYYGGAEKLLLDDNDTVVAQANANSRVNAVVSYTAI